MKHIIKATPQGECYLVEATVKEGMAEKLTGRILVAVETEAEAIAYGEDVFLCDLRVNYPKLIGALELPIDIIRAEEAARQAEEAAKEAETIDNPAEQEK